MLIDCNDCSMQNTHHCKDCVVMAILKPAPSDGAVVIDADEERALREMARAGLIPEIKMKRRSDTG